VTDMPVSKKKVEAAIQNGLTIQRLKECFDAELKEFKERVSDYSKSHKLDFYSIVDVNQKLREFNHDSREISEVLKIYPGLRFTYLRDRLERKLRHVEAETVSVTNTELLVLDKLLSEDVERLCKKYSQRMYFVKDDIQNVRDLFTDEEIRRASKNRKQGVLVSVLLVVMVVGWLVFKYIEHNS